MELSPIHHGYTYTASIHSARERQRVYAARVGHGILDWVHIVGASRTRRRRVYCTEKFKTRRKKWQVGCERVLPGLVLYYSMEEKEPPVHLRRDRWQCVIAGRTSSWQGLWREDALQVYTRYTSVSRQAQWTRAAVGSLNGNGPSASGKLRHGVSLRHLNQP